MLVDRPDVGGREEILEVHVENIKVDSDVDVKALAAITSGFVGADLANMVNEAALLAARKGARSSRWPTSTKAVERSSAGLEKKSRIMQEDEKLRVAYHEAATPWSPTSLPNTDPVHKVSIIPRGLAALGYTMQRPEQDRFLMTQGELESRIQVLLGRHGRRGNDVQRHLHRRQNDLERATEIARSMVMEFGMSRLGRVNFRESNRNPFLVSALRVAADRSITASRRPAKSTRKSRGFSTKALQRTRHILESRRAALEAISRTADRSWK